MSSKQLFAKRQLPKLMACMTRASVENLRNAKLFNLQTLDSRGIRRHKLPAYKCFILELKDAGYGESAKYLEDVIYDNEILLSEDEIGIVVDLKKRDDYLDIFCKGLQDAEKARDHDDIKKECLVFLNLALYFMDQEKGILWLADKIFLVSIAIASKYLIDGGHLRSICKYQYGRFLLHKFPDMDPDVPFQVLTEVRDMALGKTWRLFGPSDDENVKVDKQKTVLAATALELFVILLQKCKMKRKSDPYKAESLARLAARRAEDAGEDEKTAEATIEIGLCQLEMNDLNNARKTFGKAMEIYEKCNNIRGICEIKMHQAAVMQRLGDHEMASELLTEMGSLALEHNLRRQLGRALHLLGELHLRRERPELGTNHLHEAFLCFMGFKFQLMRSVIGLTDLSDHSAEVLPPEDTMENIYASKSQEPDQFLEEAEQSRLMTAISAGQEHMSSYFGVLRQAGDCTISKMEIIEWKLLKVGWWVKRLRHDFLPCLCPLHNRTPLDALWLKMEASLKNTSSVLETEFGRADTVQDITTKHSSYDGNMKM